MVCSTVKKLILLFSSLLITNLLWADLVITSASNYQELPAVGESMEVFFEVERAEEGTEFFLLTTLDDQSSMLEPAIKEDQSAQLKLRFDIPAPILSLRYSLIVKKGTEIIAGTETTKLQRSCFPILGEYAPNDKAIANSVEQTSDLFRHAKKLENDFANYEQIFMQLEHLRTVLEKKE